MHRSSNVSCIRLLHLLHAFDSRSELDDAEGCAALTLPTLCLILRFAAPGSPPRFLFALSADSSLLRSGDRGQVWKKVGVWGCPGVRAAVTSSSLPAENNDTLQSITNLLPKDDGTSEEEEEPSEPSKVRVVDSYGDTVVLGGNGGFLAVSGDRGLSFFAAPCGRLAPVLGPGADVSVVAVIDNTRILVAAGRNVAVYPLETTGCGKVSLGAGQVVLQCVSRVIVVTVCRFGLRTMIVASCTGYLYVSWNNGCDFLRIPHKLGGIRSLDPLGPVRHSMLPSILSGAKGILATLEGGEAATPAISKGSYQYASGCISDYPFGDCGDYRAVLGGVFQTSDEDHLYYRYFLATGAGTEVLEYDYSCLLCIGIKVDEGSVAVFSHGTRVTYVPFSRSAPSEPVLCACSHEPGSSSVVFARCSSVGVGFSTDLAKWTVPQIASPVSLAACDAGELIVCTQRGMTVGVGSQGKRRAVPIAGDFRLSSVIDASYL